MSATHFVTAITFHRKRLFQNQLYGELLTETLMRFRQQNSLLLHDYVIMPDHVHLLFTIYGDLTLEGAVQRLQRAFAESIAHEFGYDGELWENSFHQQELQSAEECAATIQQIHSNPVRVGFCDDPRAYRLSSTSSHWVLDPLPENLRALQPA